jgi:chemotaxis signal transduction protein
VNDDTERRSTLVFTVGTKICGVRLETVREISDPGNIAPVPRAPSLIRGLADVRGRMTTVIDVGVLVGAGPDEAAQGHLLILSEPRDHLALWTSTEISLLELEPEPRQDSGDEAMQEVCEGFALASGTRVNLLSTEKILHACEQEVLKRYQVV